MAFVKVVQSKAYFKRFQTKYRRRRQGKTDYYQRVRMIRQAKDKYNTAKYRLVVRFTNKRVIAQIVYATMAGDKVLASADSYELKRYGLTVGLKNYPAAYCAGLLIGRRVLQKLGLDKMYEGATEVTGEVVSTEQGEGNAKRTYFVGELKERRPFRCYLDVGLARTTVGSKVFAVLKGASDAGVDVPHNERNFPGYDREEKKYDAAFHRSVIFGEAIKNYQEQLIEDDQESGTTRFKQQFGVYEKAGVGPDDLEALYEKVHAAIRANPAPLHKETSKERSKKRKHTLKRTKVVAKSREQRKKDIDAKLAARAANRAKEEAEAEEEEDDDDEGDEE